MDYVAYLTPVAMEIRQLVQQKIRIIENSSICKKTTYFGAPRIIGTLQIFGGHKNAAKEAAAQENIISTIDELP
jgi:hypothetical protein